MKSLWRVRKSFKEDVTLESVLKDEQEFSGRMKAV